MYIFPVSERTDAEYTEITDHFKATVFIFSFPVPSIVITP